MLGDFGIASPPHVQIESVSEITGATAGLRFPVVLKTAEDHAHKSDVGGVVLNLPDTKAVEAAYLTISAKLGPKALVAEMAPKGVELAMGSVWDNGFGPVIVLSAGGVLVEYLDDSNAQCFRVDSSGRYAHTPDYIRKCAADASLIYAQDRKEVLRRELGKDVHGLIFQVVAPETA